MTDKAQTFTPTNEAPLLYAEQISRATACVRYVEALNVERHLVEQYPPAESGGLVGSSPAWAEAVGRACGLALEGRLPARPWALPLALRHYVDVLSVVRDRDRSGFVRVLSDAAWRVL